VLRLGEEAAALGFRHIYLTGGEPLLLPDIFVTIGALLERCDVTVLTNGTLLIGRRLAALRALLHGPTASRLTLQISMDGATPAANDAYRGAGSWQRAMAGVRTALDLGCRVRLSTTVTPANAHEVEAIGALARDLGLGPDGHVVRDLVRRGFSREGRTLTLSGLLPEVTVARDGVYWHPIATDDDLLITREILPLAPAVAEIESIFDGLMASAAVLPEAFR
jgi:MoaA/NifB/PqqE/SkfB family radical SAM enzyme